MGAGSLPAGKGHKGSSEDHIWDPDDLDDDDELRYWNPEGEGSTKRNCLQLEAKYDEERNYMAYSYVATFDYADETTLRFQGYYAKDEDGWVNFQRGDAEPSF